MILIVKTVSAFSQCSSLPALPGWLEFGPIRFRSACLTTNRRAWMACVILNRVDVNVETHQLILGILTAEEEWRPTESGTLTVRFTLEDCLKTPTSTTWRMHSLGTGGSKLCGWLDGLLALDLLRWRTQGMYGDILNTHPLSVYYTIFIL